MQCKLQNWAGKSLSSSHPQISGSEDFGLQWHQHHCDFCLPPQIPVGRIDTFFFFRKRGTKPINVHVDLLDFSLVFSSQLLVKKCTTWQIVVHVWRRGYLLPTIARKITCRRFDWMLQSSSGRKWRRCKQNITIYSHTTEDTRHQRSKVLEVPGCWVAVMRRQGGRSNPHRPLTSDDMYPQ